VPEELGHAADGAERALAAAQAQPVEAFQGANDVRGETL
jgi:hypothetical protein